MKDKINEERKKQIVELICLMGNSQPLQFDFSPHILLGSMPHALMINKKLCIVKEEVNKSEENEHFQLISKQKAINYIKKRMLNTLDKENFIEGLFTIYINKVYHLPVLYKIRKILTIEERSLILKNCWSNIEFPHQENINRLNQLFNLSDKKYLMDKKELKVYNRLPSIITVYRGLQSNKAKVKGLSWTLSLEKAKWFSNRWEKNGKVFKAKIEKEHIYMFEDGRQEKEIVLNPYCLKEIEEITEDKK